MLELVQSVHEIVITEGGNGAAVVICSIGNTCNAALVGAVPSMVAGQCDLVEEQRHIKCSKFRHSCH